MSQPYTFRPIEEADLPRLALHRNNPETNKYLTDSIPTNLLEQKRWFEGLSSKDKYFIINSTGYLASYQQGLIAIPSEVGLLRLTEIDLVNNNACIGLDIFAEFRGLGHGKAAFQQAVAWAFNLWGFNRLWLLVSQENEVAQHIYREAGFKQEGVLREHLWKDGNFVNYYLMGLLWEEWVEQDGLQKKGI